MTSESTSEYLSLEQTTDLELDDRIASGITNKRRKAPYSAIARVFHEPHRFAILSSLCAADDQLCFTQVKTLTALTDGNLNRHLYALQEAGVIHMTKSFVNLKPRTTIQITREGLDGFNAYLVALAKVMKRTRRSVREKCAAIG